MNPVLTITHNCLALTERTVLSAIAQSVETQVYAIDNGSQDGSLEWLTRKSLLLDAASINAGVSAAWNCGLEILFGRGADYVFIVNNDVILPPWFCAELLSYDVPFITGVSVDSMDAIKAPAEKLPLQGAPDFSAFLIRREAWEKIGPFDEGMKFYAQDVDYHVRSILAGMPLMKANVPFYHERSSTLKLASETERHEIEAQADRDRAFFEKKWGYKVGSPEHYRAVGFEYSPGPPKVLFPGLHGDAIKLA
jgi:GT2 family glycosyltransferase